MRPKTTIMLLVSQLQQVIAQISGNSTISRNSLLRKLRKLFYVVFASAMILNSSCTSHNDKVNDQFTYAQTRSDDLKLSIYITAHTVKNLMSDEAGCREALSIFRCNGITKAYIEVYRGGLVVEQSLLEQVKEFLSLTNYDYE
ncbi:hypothetical protein ES708_34250 [subsurface metagenome]